VSIPDIPENELLARCIRGEKEAWDIFVSRYSKLVYHSLRRTLDKNPRIQPEVIEDLHQEVFLSLLENGYKKLRQFRGKGGCSLASWIRMIASRKAIDYLRKESRIIPRQQNLGNCVSVIPDPGKGPEKRLIESENKEKMAKVITTLAPRYQLFIELFYRRDLPIEEISQIMNLDSNAVYQLHRRIKEKMREILSNDYPDLVAP